MFSITSVQDTFIRRIPVGKRKKVAVYLLKKEDLYKVLMENEMPLIPVLSLMERKGIEIEIAR